MFYRLVFHLLQRAADVKDFLTLLLATPGANAPPTTYSSTLRLLPSLPLPGLLGGECVLLFVCSLSQSLGWDSLLTGGNDAVTKLHTKCPVLGCTAAVLASCRSGMTSRGGLGETRQ